VLPEQCGGAFVVVVGSLLSANWWRSAAYKKGRRPRSSRRCRGATSPSLHDSRTLFELNSR